MTRTRPFSELAGPIMADPVRRARVEEIKRAMHVALEMGKIRDEREAALSEATDGHSDAEPDIVRIEDQGSLFLSTLRWGVRELGGELEIRTVFPDNQVIIIDESETNESDDLQG